MTDIYSASGAGTTDWVAEEARKKRKRRRGQNTANPPYDPNTSQPGLGGVPQQTPSPIDVAPGLGGFGGGADPNNPVGGGKTSTDPAQYDKARNNVTLTAFPGSFAGGLPGMGSNPYSIPAFATSPILVANKMLGDKYGLPAGSNVAGAMANYFNPMEKSLGMGGTRPVSNVDWINMGASLMQGLKGNGQQLDPGSMMANAVQAVMAEVQSMSAGGTGTSGDKMHTGWNPLTELAHQEPGQALQSFTGLMAGMLRGTMPDSEIQGYTSFLQRAGQQFLQEFYTSPDAAASEAQGISFISFLVKKLGPSLGL